MARIRRVPTLDGPIPHGVFHGEDTVPPGTFHGSDTVPPGTFH